MLNSKKNIQSNVNVIKVTHSSLKIGYRGRTALEKIINVLKEHAGVRDCI